MGREFLWKSLVIPFLSLPPPEDLPAASKALEAASEPLSAFSEALPVAIEVLLTGSKTLPTVLQAFSAL